MAGSIKWFLYTTDNATQFAIELDESNTQAVNLDAQDYTDASTIIFGIPRNLTPRYAFYANDDGTRVIRVTVLTPAVYNALLTDNRTIDDPIEGTGTLNLIRIRPERIRIPFPQDTGLDDGDAT